MQSLPTQRPFPFSVVDLTHPVREKGPVWPDDPPTRRELVARREKQGWSLASWTLGEHTGTHIGTPSHFLGAGATAESYEGESLVLPLVVVEAPDMTRRDTKALQVQDLNLLEQREAARIPDGALVVLRTGWFMRWPERDRIFERDREGRFVYPGFSEEAAEWLLRERGARALGTDAPGIDPGPDEGFAAGRAVARAGRLHVENLARLDRVPAFEAWAVLGGLPLAGGNGSPARVLALLPRDVA